MDPMTEAELESGCEPGELAGTFPANIVSSAQYLFENRNDEWTTQTLQEDFEVLGFMAPYVVCKRKFDGKKGSLQFEHNPRVYFGWTED